MKQAPGAELLDEDRGSPAEIRRSIEELWWINRHWGGQGSWRQIVARWRGRGEGGLTLLDVGAGDGRMAAWLAGKLGAATAIALDRRASHLGPTGARVAGDGQRLPFADGSVEVVVCNLFLHHFHGAAAEGLLREMGRVARRAVLISDLRRGWPPYLLMLVAGLRFSRMTRHDGRRSVRQAYTAGELRALLAASGLAGAKVMKLRGYRLGAMWERSDDGV